MIFDSRVGIATCIYFLLVGMYDKFLQKHARVSVRDFDIFTVSYNIPRAVYTSSTCNLYSETDKGTGPICDLPLKLT